MKNSKRWKDMLVGGLVVASIAALAVPTLAATGSRTVKVDYSDIKLVVNGTTVTPMDSNGNVVEPFTIDGTTYLPVRAVANALGMDVSWNGTTKTVTITDTAAATTTTTPATTTTTTGTATTGNYIGEEKAKEIALNHAGLSSSAVTFVRAQLDWDDGRAEYEVEFYSNGTEYDYDIDAVTGDIRSYDYDAEYYTPSSNTTAQTGSNISETQAKQIVQNRAGSSDGTFRQFKLDWDDGRAVYEGEYRVGWTEYDFEIDAATGTVLEWDMD